MVSKVSVIGLGEFGNSVVNRLKESGESHFVLYSIVFRKELSSTDIAEQQSSIYSAAEDSDMVFVVADMRENFPSKVVYDIAEYVWERKILSVSVLVTEKNGIFIKDFTPPGRLLCMTQDDLDFQYKFQPDLFRDGVDVVKETILGITDPVCRVGLTAVDLRDIEDVLCAPRKIRPAFATGTELESVVDKFLHSAGLDRSNTGYPAMINLVANNQRKSFLQDIHAVVSFFYGDSNFDKSVSDLEYDLGGKNDIPGCELGVDYYIVAVLHMDETFGDGIRMFGLFLDDSYFLE